MRKVLVCWIGKADLQASPGELRTGLGPIANAGTAKAYNEIHLLCDHGKGQTSHYVNWLKTHTKAQITTHEQRLSGPTQFGEIYEAAVHVVTEVASVMIIHHFAWGSDHDKSPLVITSDLVNR